MAPPLKFSPTARRQMAADRRAYRAAQRDKGLVEVRVYVPPEAAERVRLLARELRNGESEPEAKPTKKRRK